MKQQIIPLSIIIWKQYIHYYHRNAIYSIWWVHNSNKINCTYRFSQYIQFFLVDVFSVRKKYKSSNNETNTQLRYARICEDNVFFTDSNDCAHEHPDQTEMGMRSGHQATDLGFFTNITHALTTTSYRTCKPRMPHKICQNKRKINVCLVSFNVVHSNECIL